MCCGKLVPIRGLKKKKFKRRPQNKILVPFKDSQFRRAPPFFSYGRRPRQWLAILRIIWGYLSRLALSIWGKKIRFDFPEISSGELKAFSEFSEKRKNCRRYSNFCSSWLLHELRISEILDKMVRISEIQHFSDEPTELFATVSTVPNFHELNAIL